MVMIKGLKLGLEMCLVTIVGQETIRKGDEWKFALFC